MRPGRGVKTGCRIFLVLFLGVGLFCLGRAALAAGEQAEPSPSARQSGPDAAASDCARLAELVQQQKNLLTREMGQLKRELAALREDVASPGIREVFAGIGYIFGLAGVGLYVQSRKERRRQVL